MTRSTSAVALLFIFGPITAGTFVLLSNWYARRAQRRETIKRRLVGGL